MGTLRIETRGGKTAFAPRDEIAGTAVWSLDQPPSAVQLRLFWFTKGKGTQDVGIVASLPFEGAGREERREFRFELPEAPYSFSGTLVSVLWAIELVAEPSGETARFEFTMGPGGKEVVLPERPPGRDERAGEAGSRFPGGLRKMFGGPVRNRDMKG